MVAASAVIREQEKQQQAAGAVIHDPDQREQLRGPHTGHLTARVRSLHSAKSDFDSLSFILRQENYPNDSQASPDGAGMIRGVLTLAKRAIMAAIRRDERSVLELTSLLGSTLLPRTSDGRRLLAILERAVDPQYSSGDAYFRYKTLCRMGNIVSPSYRFDDTTVGWLEDKDFGRYLERFSVGETMSAHRKWTVWQLARLIKSVEGDTVECGVYRGATSWLICSAITGQGRIHHMFDSFEGLSKPELRDGSYWKPGDLSVERGEVERNMAPFSNYRIYPGWIPTRFDEVTSCRFALVHIDVDLYAPTLDSLQFFYPRMSQNGIIICDDYGFSTCPGVTECVDEFLADKPEKMVLLPNGGGMLIRGVITAPAQQIGSFLS